MNKQNTAREVASAKPNVGRRVIWVVSGLVLALAVGPALLCQTVPSSSVLAQAPRQATPRVSSRKSRRSIPPTTPRRVPAKSPEKPSEPALRVAATLDKSEVCRNEQNFVNVSVDTDVWTEGFVRIRVEVPGMAHKAHGSRVPFRMSEPSEGHISIRVEALHSTEHLTLPPPVVKDCDESVVLALTLQHRLGSLGRVTAVATWDDHVGDRSQAFDPVEFEWDFGDGDSQTTKSPTVRHNYEGRPQDRLKSNYVVSVKARDEQGVEAVASQALSLSNRGFLTLAFRDEVSILSSLDAWAREEPADYWLYHGHDQGVDIKSVYMVERRWPEGASVPVETEAVELPVAETLGFTRLEVGESYAVRGLRGAKPPGLNLRRIYEVVGVSEDGKHVYGKFEI